MTASRSEPLATVGHGQFADREAPALQIGRLYEQHRRMVAALCRVLLRDPVEAEDALQQTFLSAFGSLISGTVPRRPGPWLATIARRECWARAAQRRRQPVPFDEASDPVAAEGDPVESAIRRADCAALWTAINGLSPNQRRAFLLREFSGLSYTEVALALGVTESATEALLVRARRQLRDGLAASNFALTPLVLLQHRITRLLGFGNPGARAGATAAVGLPVAIKLTGTTAVIVAVGSVGVGLKDTVFAHHVSHASRPPATRSRPTERRATASLHPAAANRVRGTSTLWPPVALRSRPIATHAPLLGIAIRQPPHAANGDDNTSVELVRTHAASQSPASDAKNADAQSVDSPTSTTDTQQNEQTGGSDPAVAPSTDTTPSSSTTSGDGTTTAISPADATATDGTSTDGSSPDATAQDQSAP